MVAQIGLTDTHTDISHITQIIPHVTLTSLIIPWSFTGTSNKIFEGYCGGNENFNMIPNNLMHDAINIDHL